MKYNHKIALKNTPHFFGGLECGGHSFAYVAHFVFLEMSGLEPSIELQT
jgi:hypothetical protein